jgi:UDPglucose 6-dehydrogenase
MGSTIAVIGAGYVGLTTGACFAHLGHKVTCADVVEAKVDSLQRGEIPIHEARLEELVRAGMDNGNLSFVVDSEKAVRDAEFVYLCVPTPQTAEGSADLRYLTAAVQQISPHLQPGTIVVNKSTVPVGSTLLVKQALSRSDIPVVSNPEFLREGSAVDDFLHPDRVVIGSDDEAAASHLASLYVDCGAPIMVTDPASAETCKYAANAFLAAKLSFTNAIAAVCEAVGADVNDVLLGMGYDHRIGHEFLRPGPGWGGSCLPKDSKAIISIAEDAGYDFALMRGVIQANDEQFDRIVRKVESVTSLDGATVGVLGIAFKAGTDDTRESPAIEVMKRLLAKGAMVKAYDPAVTSLNLDGVDVVGNAYAACEGASAIVVATEWDEFTSLDFDRVGTLVAERNMIDARNLLGRDALTKRGFTYQGVGRS